MMKRILCLILLFVSFLTMPLPFFVVDVIAQETKPQMSLATSQESDQEQVIVYYFHSTFRCVSCKNIEAYTKEAVEKYFSSEIASGKILFKVVNVEQPQNKHFMGDYQLYTKSVVLSRVKDGKEETYKNLDKVWQLLRNKEKFYLYIKEELENFLN